MFRLRVVLVSLALLVGVGLTGASSAIAANCGGSAGDTQYVDPLACGGGSGGNSGGGGSPTTRATPPATSPSAAGPLVASTATTHANGSTTAAPATATTASASASSTASSNGSAAAAKDLPYTGLDVRTLLFLGVGLLGAGVLLRRFVARRAGG